MSKKQRLKLLARCAVTRRRPISSSVDLAFLLKGSPIYWEIRSLGENLLSYLHEKLGLMKAGRSDLRTEGDGARRWRRRRRGTPTSKHLAAFQSWHDIRSVVEGYAHGIIRLIGESYGPDSVQQGWREFTIDSKAHFPGDDPNTELFFSWLFHHWSPTLEKGNSVYDGELYGVAPTRAYLDRASSQINPLLRRYLETCLVSVPAFYQVNLCKPQIGFRAQNVLTENEIEVSEGLASTSLKNGDIVFASLVSLEDVTVLDAISPLSFPSRIRKPLTRLCKAVRGREHGAEGLRELYFSLLK